MKWTEVTVSRGSGSNIREVERDAQAQIDQQTLDMAQFDGGAAPYDLFNIFYYGVEPVKRNDHLTDEDGTIYTVSSRVEPFPDGHQEFQAQVPVRP